MARKSAIVVGAGIVGLAMTRALAIRGYQVTVVERTARAIGASIRNFGMVWPIGQPDGKLYERAMLSRSIWQSVCAEAGIWYEQKGSLHLAYAPDELRVLEELAAVYTHRDYRVITSGEVARFSPVVVQRNLLGALYSEHEMVVDPPRSIAMVATFLEERYGVRFLWECAATSVAAGKVSCGNQIIEADEIYICSGIDFETLYPELFRQVPLTRCKLQMMRLRPEASTLRIGPSLCAALSLLHYEGFRVAPSLAALRKRLTEEHEEAIRWGIHVMASQHEGVAVTVGDSHEYGPVHDPFDRESINRLILERLFSFADFGPYTLQESWNGVYAKLKNGGTEWVAQPERGVMIVNGLGGAGMTLSFGLCEELIADRS